MEKSGTIYRTILSKTTVISIKKNNTDQRLGNGIILIAVGNTTKASPGPVNKYNRFCKGNM